MSGDLPPRRLVQGDENLAAAAPLRGLRRLWYNVAILTARSGCSRCGASLRLKWLEEIPATYDFMADVTLSIFVDESGRFQFPDATSPYYIVSLVLHDQRKPIDGLIAELERHFSEMRLSNVCFHAGPLIRQKNAFAILDWSFRVKIFRRMLAFAHKLDFNYHCLVVEKRFVDSKEQLIERLERDLTAFFDNLSVTHPEFNHIKVYYDCGQTPVTNILLSAIKSRAGLVVDFAQAVTPERYKLFQLADMVATLKLVELKLSHGEPMTNSEFKFFGGPRKFKNNYLRFVKAKEI